MKKILAINPGSTSTKIAVYNDNKPEFVQNIMHPDEEIAQYSTTNLQLDYRLNTIEKALLDKGIATDDFAAVVGRGGAAPGLATGGYAVNDALKDAMLNHPLFDHVSNLGAPLAGEFAKKSGCPAFIYDAVSADVLTEEAKITGFAGLRRSSLCHILNARATALKYAENVGRPYEELNLIVVHLGGGISLCAHRKGRIIDTIRDDGGPFSPTRAGSVNLMDAVDLCYSGKYTYAEMARKVRGDAGLVDLLGTHDAIEVERRIAEGDSFAALVYRAMALQIAKGAASLIACFTEPVDTVIITGGMAHSAMLTEDIARRLRHTVDVTVMAGENEMESLALGGLRIISGLEAANPPYVLK